MEKKIMEDLLTEKVGKPILLSEYNMSGGAVTLGLNGEADDVREVLKLPIGDGGFGINQLTLKTGGIIKFQQSKNKKGFEFLKQALLNIRSVEDWSIPEVLRDLKKLLYSKFGSRANNATVNYNNDTKLVVLNLTNNGVKNKTFKKIITEEIPEACRHFGLQFVNDSKTASKKAQGGYVPGIIIHINSEGQKKAAIEFIKAGGVIPEKPKLEEKDKENMEKVIDSADQEQHHENSDEDSQQKTIKLSEAFMQWQLGDITEQEKGSFTMSVFDMGRLTFLLMQAIAEFFGAEMIVAGRTKRNFLFDDVQISNGVFPLEILEQVPKGHPGSFMRQLFAADPTGFGLRKRLEDDGVPAKQKPKGLPESSGWMLQYALLEKERIIRATYGHARGTSRDEEEEEQILKKLEKRLYDYGCVFKKTFKTVARGKDSIYIRADLSLLGLMGSRNLGGNALPEGWIYKYADEVESVVSDDSFLGAASKQSLDDVEEKGDSVQDQDAESKTSRPVKTENKKSDLGEEMLAVLEKHGYHSSADLDFAEVSTEDLVALLLERLNVDHSRNQHPHLVYLSDNKRAGLEAILGRKLIKL